MERTTLFHRQPSNLLRDLLKLRDDDVIPRVTLAAVLASEKPPPASSGRTLLDIIRDDNEFGSATWTPGSGSGSAAPAGGSATIRVSLMTLMELGEREEEVGESRVSAADVAVEEEDDDVAEEGRKHVCCVCMVRKKGAAFIPCGHTFCRVCSRELCAGRGNCPLCNAAIAEVLDIF